MDQNPEGGGGVSARVLTRRYQPSTNHEQTGSPTGIHRHQTNTKVVLA